MKENVHLLWQMGKIERDGLGRVNLYFSRFCYKEKFLNLVHGTNQYKAQTNNQRHKWCAKWKQIQYSYFSWFMLCCNFSFSLLQKAIFACSWLVSDETFFFPLKVDITDKVKHKIGEFGNIELYLNVTYLKGNIACQTFRMDKIVFLRKQLTYTYW